MASDFEKTFAKLRQLPCDVFLAPHGSFFRRAEKMALLEAGREDAFVNSEDLKTYVDQSRQAFRKELIRQREKSK
jgi:metallo-beta-lactamase class B